MLSQKDLEGNSVRDVYELTQAALAQKQQTIDSLRAVLVYREQNDTVSGAIAPELAVVFPQVTDMAVTRAVFATTESGRLDTVNVALVRLAQPLPKARREELSRYLEARLRLREVEIVEI